MGASTMHCGRRPGCASRRPLGRAAMIFSTTGSAKASVLPEPVLARAIMSLPAMAGSNTIFWIGNMAWMFLASSALTVMSDSPQLTS